jgi:hypothetical protein
MGLWNATKKLAVPAEFHDEMKALAFIVQEALKPLAEKPETDPVEESHE